MSTREITLTVNGEEYTETVEDRRLLVHFLREDLGLTGTHQGCVIGKCGACTVLHDGDAKKSCMLYAVQVQGDEITTVEGLEDIAEREEVAVDAGDDTAFHPVQAGFKEKHGLQCGFCTPGMLMSSYALLEENPDPSDEEIRTAISGNICRCTGYNSILESVRWAGEELRGEHPDSEVGAVTDGGDAGVDADE
jgi:carbon-monoxide dehydrogenase small subunit